MKLARTVAALCLGIAALACSGGSGGDSDRAGGDQEPAAAEQPADPLEITTELGVVRGKDSEVDGVRAFLAMPFAAPPSGENRWRPPQPREPYDEPFDATQTGASCPQADSALAALTPIPEADEDCLTLNVWSPDDARDLPVMFWIHGGGFTAGSAHQDYYIGDHLADRDVVVVSANYRLGSFGFLATSALAEESDDGSYGNYGLADQQAALEWVQENVEAFGGDPDNVTIFGESAGGGSVCGHLGSPLSDGLYQRAIIQSGGGCGTPRDGEAAKTSGDEWMATAGCSDLACLRQVPTEQILAAGFSPSLTLMTDGVRLPEGGRDRAAAGDLEGIEVITGSNRDEHTLFSLGMQNPDDAALRGLFAEVSDDPDALLALYPAGEYEDNLARYRALQTDIRFACPTLTFAEAAENETYLYNYVFESPSDPFGFGPTHGTELVPLFRHPEGIAGLPPILPAPDAAISEAMQEAWVAFATEGVPGDESAWRPYGDGNQVTMIDAEISLADEFRGGRCDDVAAHVQAPW